MKNSSFNDLSPDLKHKIVEEFATPVVSLEYYDYRIDLFELNSHLIEQYQHIETGRIERITEATYADLDKYLGQIIIGNLMKHTGGRRPAVGGAL